MNRRHWLYRFLGTISGFILGTRTNVFADENKNAATSAESKSKSGTVNGAESDTVTLAFVGDIMVDNLPGEVIASGKDPFAHFAPIFQSVDVMIGNLECVVATTGAALEKPWTFRASPRVIPYLKKHFTAVGLANNHSGDFGKGAFVECLELLEKAELPQFGGGRNLAAARKPWLIDRAGFRIAVLGYNEFKPRSFAASDTEAGIAWSVDEHVFEDIKRARTEYKADVVIPFMHWGFEGETQPNERQKTFARKIIDAGADMVIAGHPHVTQGVEYYNGKLIVYSLGNFVFDEFVSAQNNKGWLVRLKIDKQGLREWDVVWANLDERGIPSPDLMAVAPFGKRGNEEIESRRPSIQFAK
jgi:poly-gamma-glutamate capsule biosynthesis protein CapA/YwtB (metallophosphatase superfamily)